MASKATGSGKHIKPLPQECWRMMRRGCNMQKIWVGTRTKVKASRKAQGNKTNLTKDQKQIVFSVKRKEKKVPVTDIAKILTSGSDPDKFESIQNQLSVEVCFAVVVTSTSEEIFFAAPSTDEANLWVNGLEYLLKNETTKKKGEERREMWLKKEFSKLTKNRNDFVKYVDLLSFLTSQGMNVDPSFVKKSLHKFMGEKRKTDEKMNQRDFVQFFERFLTREEFLNLFVQASSNGSFMTVDDLEYFLTRRQNESVSHDDCIKLIKSYEVTQEGRDEGELGIDGFIKYMSSKEGELFNPKHDKVYQDMTQPFAHYYIASSHNTYLCGDQLQGESSVDEYVKVLKEGCRCVELDCWDGDHGEPVVYHGHTLTSKILFKDVIEAIAKHAFEVSPYPVILNMENHCSVEYQKTMARYLVDILGDNLHRNPVDKKHTTSPSPEEFKYKIFIRAKKLNPEAEESNEEFAMVDDDDDDDDDDEEEDEKGSPQPQETKDTPDTQDSTDGKKKKKPPKPIATEFSRLINHFVNTHFVSFDHSAKEGLFYQSSSFAEKKLSKFLERHPDVFVDHNKRQLSRIYPGGFRVDSSNYDPQNAWNVGCQIVALNHQTCSEPVQLHHGKFRQNGKSGYVLKPEFLRRPGTKFNPLALGDLGNMGRTFKITIISGYRLSPPQKKGDSNKIKQDLDPYVVVDIHGVPADKYKFRTKTIKDNSFNPRWDQGFCQTIHVPELALVRFCVYDDDFGFDDFIGQSTFPFTSIRQGYRQIILMDKKNQPYTCGTLFVHVTISEGDIFASTADSAYTEAEKSRCTIA